MAKYIVRTENGTEAFHNSLSVARKAAKAFGCRLERESGKFVAIASVFSGNGELLYTPKFRRASFKQIRF